MKFETKQTYHVEWHELEELVNKTYGFEPKVLSYGGQEWPYSFVAVEECGNDSSHEFSVDAELDEWSEEELQKWIASGGKTWIGNHAILDDLCRRGLIPAGEWVVRVSW